MKRLTVTASVLGLLYGLWLCFWAWVALSAEAFNDYLHHARDELDRRALAAAHADWVERRD